MALVHAVANQKGGVGKTTIAVNLAAVTHDVLVSLTPAANQTEALDHSPVSVVSTDPQQSSVWWAERVKHLPFHFDQATDPAAVTRASAAPHRRHVFVDTPGSLEDGHILAAVLDVADDVIVPMPPAPLAYDPTARTIEHVLRPRGVPFRVVINDWDPRDGDSDLRDTVNYVLKKGWPLSNVVIRRYKVHTRASAEGRVVTQYPKNRTSMEAREDFYRLALDLGLGGTPATMEAR